MRKLFVLLLLVIYVPLVGAQGLVVGIVDNCSASDDGQMNSSYCTVLKKGGNEPVFIACSLDSIALRRQLEKLDVVFLTGGEDVNPARYGEEPSPYLGTVHEVRDTFEYRVLTEAVKMRIPIFGTCRGEQMINVFFGGTLYQDIPSEIPTAHSHWKKHQVRLKKHSRLCKVLGTKTILTNSTHHQAVKDVAPGFRVVATSEDGVVEAIESKKYHVAAVQFHPEVMWDDDERFLNIYSQMKKLLRMN